MVGIIIPAYRAGRYISRCLDSIHAQTYSNYMVLVVVDDAHYDNTLDILKYHPLAEAGKLVYHCNSSKTTPAISRNIGIATMRADYDPVFIAFCDADDWWEPTKLERQLMRMFSLKQEDPVIVMCYTLSTWVFEDGRKEIHGTPHGKVPIWLVCTAPHSSVLVSARVAELIPFDERLDAADDYRWLLDIYNAGFEIGSINEPLTNVGIDGNNLTQGENGKFIMQSARVHWVDREYHIAALKIVLGCALLLKRKLLGNLGLSAKWSVTA